MKAHEVTEFDEFLVQLVERMTQLMDDAQGVGLAATQVGVLQRLFVFAPGEERGAVAVVNPRLVDPSEATETDEEGCLSLEGVRVPVERSTSVTLEGVDPDGSRAALRARGPRRARRPARGRPPRRRADHRPHRRGAPQGGARAPAPADRPALMRVAVAATAAFGAEVLGGLAAAHEIAYLLTRPDAPRGRGRQARRAPRRRSAPRGSGSRCTSPRGPSCRRARSTPSSSAPTGC